MRVVAKAIVMGVCMAVLGSACGARAPDMTAGQAGVAEANGIRIAYESFGPAERETVLLIAGYTSQMTMWPDELFDRRGAAEHDGRSWRAVGHHQDRHREPRAE